MEGGDKGALEDINRELVAASQGGSEDEETSGKLMPSLFERLIDSFEKASFELIYTDESQTLVERNRVPQPPQHHRHQSESEAKKGKGKGKGKAKGKEKKNGKETRKRKRERSVSPKPKEAKSTSRSDKENDDPNNDKKATEKEKEKHRKRRKTDKTEGATIMVCFIYYRFLFFLLLTFVI